MLLPTIHCPLHVALCRHVADVNDGDADAANPEGDEDFLKTLQQACTAALEEGRKPRGKLRQNRGAYGGRHGKKLLSTGGPLTTGSYVSRSLAFIHANGLQHRVLIHRHKLAMDIYQVGVVVYVSRHGGDAGGISPRLLGDGVGGALKLFMEHAVNSRARRSGRRVHVIDAAGRIAFADGTAPQRVQWSASLGPPAVRGFTEAPYYTHFVFAAPEATLVTDGCVAASAKIKGTGALKRIYVVPTKKDVLRCKVACGGADGLSADDIAATGAADADAALAALKAAEFPGMTAVEIADAVDAQYHCMNDAAKLDQLQKPTLMMKGVVTVLDHALAIFSSNEAADILGVSLIPVETRRLLARHLRCNEGDAAERVWADFCSSSTDAAAKFLAKAVRFFSRFTKEQIGVRAWKWLLMSSWTDVEVPARLVPAKAGDCPVGVGDEAMAMFRSGRVPGADASQEVQVEYQALLHACTKLVSSVKPAVSDADDADADGDAGSADAPAADADSAVDVEERVVAVFGVEPAVAKDYAKMRFLVQHAFRKQPDLEKVLVERSQLTSGFSLAVFLHMLTEAETTMSLNTDVNCQQVFESLHGRKWRTGSGHAKMAKVARYLTARVRYGKDTEAFREAVETRNDDWVLVTARDTSGDDGDADL